MNRLFLSSIANKNPMKKEIPKIDREQESIEKKKLYLVDLKNKTKN